MWRCAITRLLLLGALLSYHGTVYAWHDETHLAIAKAAGYRHWYNAAAADLVKVKARRVEENNHWYNNNSREEIRAETVLKQAERYDHPDDPEGHLLGAIVASLRQYQASTDSQKYAEYHLAFCAHYIGDLSQPLHNTPYGEFNRVHHLANDGVVEKEALGQGGLDAIRRHMYPIRLGRDSFERDLATQVARIANLARALGYRLERENRDMTREEAYLQLGHSASLLKAVLEALRDRGAAGAKPAPAR